ncbi:MAG: dethiobiotin synthase [Muribaculaceae bacterium]|nr:dethiobiotin synthase [Muribaculaceae bacterium]
MKEALFLSGIGTDIGKSYATAWLLNHIAGTGKKVITQKFIQTGCEGESIDIKLHRRLNGMELTEEDRNLVTAPIILSYPASPHLAAIIDNKQIDLSAAREATRRLLTNYDTVIIEGAGGIMVPVSEGYLTIDYITDNKLPLAFVTHGSLGSISDTLLALEAIKNRGIELRYVIYNPYFDNDKVIAEDAREYMQRKVNSMFPETEFLIMDEDYTSRL